MSSIFSSYSEAFASELLENNEELIHRYYMHSDMLSIFKFSSIAVKVLHRLRGIRLLSSAGIELR